MPHSATDSFANTLGFTPVQEDEQAWRDALFAQLVKIRDICATADIPVHLHGVCALAAWRDNQMWDTPMMCIDVRDARRFAQAIRDANDPHLQVASMETDAHFPTFEYRVYDPDTISFDALQAYKFEQNCLHVRVRFFLHLPDDKQELARAKKIMQAYRKRNDAYYATGKEKPAGLVKLLPGMGDGDEAPSPSELASATFATLVDAYSGDGARIAITGKQFDDGFLNDLQPVQLKGEQFQMPAQAETYFATMIGDSWRERSIGEFGDSAAKFRDTRHAWSDFASRIEGIDYDKYAKAREVHRALGVDMKPHDQAIARYYAIVSCTHHRFDLWTRYMPQKDELKRLYEAGDYDELEKRLDRYLKKLEDFRKKGLGLCFDPEIFEITKGLLVARGKAAYADELDALVADVHREPIAPPPPNPGIEKYHENQQALLLDMLARLVDFMEERGIRYYLLGGTCIGGVRHEGFIPWDDDIDLIIDRENYDKLVAAFAEHPFDDLELNCYEFNDNWRRPFAQLSYTGNSVYLKTTFINRGKANGTRIDIMIIDKAPSARLEQFGLDLMMYQEVNMDAVYYNKRLGRYIDDYLWLKDMQEENGRVPVVEALKEKVESYANDPDCDRLTVRFYVHVLRAFEAAWFEGERFCKFENIQTRIPTKAEACMRLQYGYDWYLIPPGNPTRSHGFQYSWVFPGDRFQEDIEHFIDIDEAERIVFDRKKLNVRRTAAKRDMESVTFDLNVQRILMHLDLDAHADDLHQLYEHGKFDEFLRYIAPLAAERKSLPRLAAERKRIPSVVLEDWTRILVENGQYYTAEKLLRAFEEEPPEIVEAKREQAQAEQEKHASPFARIARFFHKDKAPAGQTTAARAVLDPVLELAAAFQDRDFDAEEKALGSFGPGDTLHVPDILIAQTQLKLGGRLSNLDWSAICADCETYLAIHPDNQDVRKVFADALWERGERERARDLYEIAHATTRNGLDILAIEKRLPDITPRFESPVKDML